MKENRAYPRTNSCSDGPTGDDCKLRRLRSPRPPFAWARGACIIRLIGLLLFAGTANVCAGAESPGAGTANRQGVCGPIRDPLNPQAYMAELASKLNSSDDKNLLMQGMRTQKIQQTGPSYTRPAPTQPVAGSSAGVAPNTQKSDVPKPKPVPQVPAMMVWNGLSSDNRAAQRVLDELGASPVAAGATSFQSDAGEKINTPPARPAAPTAEPAPRGFKPLDQALMSARPGLILWTGAPARNAALEAGATPSPANLVEKVTLGGPRVGSDPNAGPATPRERTGSPLGAASAPSAAARRASGAGHDSLSGSPTPWSLGADLDKYRAHAVNEGSRDSGQSLRKALERAGLAVGDGVNIFVLGYASDRAKPFRGNDGKGLLDEPGKVPQRAGATAVNFTDGLYSVADLISLDSLPNPAKDEYTENHPLVRPLVFTGRTIGGAWKTTEEIGNAVTWGYFDNVTGCVGLLMEDILELVKHVGQAATNVVRAPVQLVAGKKEATERAMDWVLLVPLEFVSNSIEMKGIANMGDYQTAFADKGVIGSVLEFGGSTFLVYRTIDEIVDELKDDKRCRRTSESQAEPEQPPPENPPAIPETPHTPGSDLIFYLDGEWPTVSSSSGIVYWDELWPSVSIWMY